MSYDPAAAPCAVYVSWPFTVPTNRQAINQYHSSLIKEITQFASSYQSNVPLESIYWGGGCLRTYPERLVLDTSAKLRSTFTFSQATEVTFEIDSGIIHKEQLELWGRLGVNRLVIRVKNLADLELVPFDIVQSTGFENIAVDLTLGQPGVSRNEWETLIHAAAIRPITHLSVYFSENNSRLRQGFDVQAAEDGMAGLYCWTVQALVKHGFEHYEMYGFFKPGFRSKQQQVYFDRKPYKGFGAGACSSQSVTSQQERLEKIMLGLRQTRGIERTEVNASDELLDELKKQGLIKLADERVALTPAGFLVSNEIIVKLF